MYHFCTIASANYLPFVDTLCGSLIQQHPDTTLHVLVTETSVPQNGPNIRYYSLADIESAPYTQQVMDRYIYNNDYLRWSLKPVFLLFLTRSYPLVIYVDNDIHFFGSFDFLFKQLEAHSLLLTPHWCSYYPLPEEENFKTNYQIGLYNAGFVGASAKAEDILLWWVQVCLHEMKKDDKEGLFDDQRYLDMAPIIDENVGIVRHTGCNLGSWNMHQNKRLKKGDQVLINGTYPIVFIHFNHDTVWHITNGNDDLLRPYFDRYEKDFSKTGYELVAYIKGLSDWKERSMISKIRHKTILRTRLKRWLFRLSRKL